MDRKKENIINFDIQGWPLFQNSIKDIIKHICTYDEENNRYYIDADDKRLDLIPRVFEDDGMGYGVNEKRIVEFNVFGDKEQYCNIFVEEPIKNVELWVEAKFYPQCLVKQGRKRYMVEDIRKTDDGVYEYYCQRYNSRDGLKDEYLWLSEDKIKYD